MSREMFSGANSIQTVHQSTQSIINAAREVFLQPYVVNCASATDKYSLLYCFAQSLNWDADFGYNWDALYDMLRDYPESVLVLEHFTQIPKGDLDTLLVVLTDTLENYHLQQQRFFVFLNTEPQM